MQGSFPSSGYNLIGQSDGNSGFTNGLNGDIVGSTVAPINPVLGPLGDNGGPTPTMALLHGSPGLDAGTDELLLAPFYVRTDQRGFPRLSGSHVDIGAFEFQFQNTPAGSSVSGPVLSANISLDDASQRNAAAVTARPFTRATVGLQLAFSAATPGTTFSVLATTNPAAPINNWIVIGQPTQVEPGNFYFTDSEATNYPQRFYRVSSP